MKKCLLSIKNQVYLNYEVWIIDGDSTDGTKEFLKTLEKPFNFISEQDIGIYDAMNKGMQHATGDYLWYIHADDQIYAPNTLSLAMQNHADEDFIYGKTLLIDEQGNERSHETRKPHPLQFVIRLC